MCGMCLWSLCILYKELWWERSNALSVCIWSFMIPTTITHICVTVHNKTEWSINLCSGLCVCVHARVCEGHSTVPYIKLSASWHCSMNKWSPTAGGGGVVSWLWIKSVPSLRSLMLGILCPCALLCCMCVYAHKVHSLLTFSVDAQIQSLICSV